MEEINKKFNEKQYGRLVSDETNRLYVRTKEYPDGELITNEEVDIFIQSEIDLAVSKERERIVEMIEKEIDRIKNGDIKWVGLRKALKLIQNERTI